MKANFFYAAFLILPGFFSHCTKSDAPPQIKVTNIWSRPATVTGVVYMHIDNSGGPDRLVSASSDVAEYVEIHESYMKDDRMKMRHLAEGLVIPASNKVELKPGGLHIMLINLTQKLVSGDSFELKLHFVKTGDIRVISNVMKDSPAL